ncbi:MAG TPA: winged helix-turn-helix domain-containing protein [Steroidobacteraceae bacterium]|nr:winged helix-turn-helix domain-containing protein [Steroidobacteraceae bacterium]
MKSTATEARTYEFEGFRLDVARRQLLTGDGRHIDLPSRAFDLLLYVVERPGELLDKSTLLKSVWPTTVVEESNLSQCIFALRRALGDTAQNPRFIATVPGRGYQFVAQVRMEPRNNESLPPDPAVTPSPGSVRTIRPEWIAAGVVALAVIGLIAWLSWPRADAPGSDAALSAGVPAPRTIAVLPFTDLSPDRDMEYFADGIAEEMMNSLGKVESLRVVGRQSAFAFKGTNEDARSIGKKLGVDSILEGSVRKAGDRIRISARLVRTRDGFTLWSQTYDRKLDDVLDIQSAIASEVAVALSPVIKPASLAGAPSFAEAHMQTKNPDAYDAYLRGIAEFRRGRFSDLRRVRDHFQRAVELDPQFAIAHALLAATYAVLSRTGFDSVAEYRSLSAASLDRAIKLEPQIADLWWVRTWLQGNADSLTMLVHNLERAQADNPNNGELMASLARVYLRVGRRAEALDLAERARNVDPLWVPAILGLANSTYLYKSDRQRTLALIDEAQRLAPGDAQVADFRALMAFSEGRALDWDHWKAKAIELAPRDPPLHGYLSLDYAHLGVLDAALHHARIAQDLTPKGAGGPYGFVHIHLFSGNVDAARPVVQRVMAERPEDFLAQRAQAELQYFTGDCGGAIHSLELAQPGLMQPAGSTDMMWDPEQVALLVWCLRKQGNAARAQEFARAFEVQLALPVTPGVMDGIRARMAAATGDRGALVRHLRALVETKSMAFAFARHEPMIQPYLQDPDVKALLDTLDAHRAEWRRILPRSTMRVPIPGDNVEK